MSSRIDTLQQQLQQIDALRANGSLSESAAAEARAELERQLVAAVMAQPAAPAAPVAPPTDVSASREPGARPSRRLLAGLGLFVVLVGGLGYAWKGSPQAWSVGPGSAAQSADAAGPGGQHSMNMQQIESMLDALRQRLKDQPDDAEGWLMLARSLSVLGRFDEAVPAYRRVLSLQADNAQAMADLADALAMRQQGSFAGEPERLIAAALKVDPKHLKALALAGTQAFEAGQLPQAIALWERAAAVAKPGSDMAKQLQDSLAEARQALAGGAPASAAATASATSPTTGPTTAPSPQAAAGGRITGRVELAPSLAGKVQPDDTVFIFARPAEGPRMPLAILRKQVRDLPTDFSLDDSLAMSPASRLSGASAVVVGARVSRSGQAMPQPGDLQGLSATVAPGAQGLRIVISDTLP